MSKSFPPTADPQKSRLSRLAISGAALLPFGFLLGLFFIPISTSLLAVIIPFASTTLGLISISQIRKSAGEIYGLPLAVFVSLFYPIVVLSGLLVILGWTFLGTLSRSSLIPLAWLFVILLIDYLIVRLTWRAAKH
jgi:hypothetical protein